MVTGRGVLQEWIFPRKIEGEGGGGGGRKIFMGGIDQVKPSDKTTQPSPSLFFLDLTSL